jgi:hypothetical protein
MNCTKSGTAILLSREAMLPLDRRVEIGRGAAVVDRVRPRIRLVQLHEIEVERSLRLAGCLRSLVTGGGVEQKLGRVSLVTHRCEQRDGSPVVAEAQPYVLARGIHSTLNPHRLGH